MIITTCFKQANNCAVSTFVQFVLCTKVLTAQLLACLKQVVKIINFVKASALNTWLFKQLCEDLGSEHTSLLYHTEVHWLSRGNASKRLFEMKNKILLLFKELVTRIPRILKTTNLFKH